jgi:hypothetical protein
MRIVGDGNWDQWRLKVTCSGCGTVLEIDRHDIYTVRPGYGYWCKCGNCGKSILVMDADVPEYLRDKARVKK